MDDQLLLGLWRCVLPVPPQIWQRIVKGDANLEFMSADHHRVRNLVVEALPREGRPLSPAWISQKLSLTLSRVGEILDDLERNMTFLFRNPEGAAVTWAYPVTVDKTPHHVSFSSGERVYAAWAIDTIATPFVQGRLRNEKLTFTIETECGHCGEPIHLEIDSDLNYGVLEKVEPLVYVPMMDVTKLEDPSIIDSFWRKSIFFWSEEHAKDYRRKTGGERGIYATLDQSVYITRIVQSALFGFDS